MSRAIPLMKMGSVRALIAVNAFPLAIGILALTVWGLGEGTAEVLAYRRQAILGGEWWRLLSGHWVHGGWRHLLLNLIGLGLVWQLFGKDLRAGCWLALLVIVAAGQSLGLLVFYPGVVWFEGLSGLLHGLLAASAILCLRRSSLLAGLALVALAIKLSLEAWQGASPAMAIWLDGPVLTESHWCGAIAGVAGGCVLSATGRSWSGPGAGSNSAVSSCR